MMANILDCGHAPTRDHGIGTGYALDADDKRYCYECADELQRADMAERGQVFAYVSSDGRDVTTWTGGKLATVTGHKVETRYTPTGGQFERHYYSAREGGRDWHGIGAGPGMYVRLRRRTVRGASDGREGGMS